MYTKTRSAGPRPKPIIVMVEKGLLKRHSLCIWTLERPIDNSRVTSKSNHCLQSTLYLCSFNILRQVSTGQVIRALCSDKYHLKRVTLCLISYHLHPCYCMLLHAENAYIICTYVLLTAMLVPNLRVECSMNMISIICH